MGGFVKNIAKNPGRIFDTAKGAVESGVSAVGDILAPDIEMPEMLEEELVDPQEAVTEAAKKKRARIKKQQEQSTLLTGATTTGGTSSLLG